MTLRKRVGGIIRRNRKAAGLTQAELATRIGVDQSTVQKWEYGINWPGAEDLEAMAGAFGVDPVRLLVDPVEAAELVRDTLERALK